MDGCETVFRYNPLRNQDRIFKVVTIPGHECDQHVLAKGKFTKIGRRAISQYVTFGHNITKFHQWTLIHTGVLIRALILDEVIDIHTGITGRNLIFIGMDNNTSCIYLVNNTTPFGNRCYTGIGSDYSLHPGTYQWFLSNQRRNSLTLHIRTHQGAVGIIVLKEWNQRRRHRNNLLGRDIHIVDFTGLF